MASSTLICLILALYCLYNVKAFTYPILTDYFIYDLYADDPGDFANLASSWNITNPVTPGAYRVGYCANIILLGGTGLLGQNTTMERTYSNLPAHTYISFILRALDINQWASSDSVGIYIDGTRTHNLHPSSDCSGTWQVICGTSSKDFIWYDAVGVMAHNASSLTVKYVISNSNYTNSSYGIHNLNILFRTQVPYQTNRMCVGQPNSLSPPCYADGQHYYVTDYSSQGVCHPYCNTCFGPGSNNCFGCGEGCFFNGTDCNICNSTCKSCFGPAANQCNICPDGNFLQADNNTCTQNCTFPYAIDGNYSFKVCYSPCNSSQYIYYDPATNTTTCRLNCTSPYTIVDLHSNTSQCILCQSTEYRAFNTTGDLYCASNCTAPYFVKNTSYCLLCDFGTYISYNSSGQQTCVANCNAPYQIMNKIYCLICPLGQYISYNSSGQQICVDNCSSPYQIANNIYCLICPLNQYIFNNSLGELSCMQNCSIPFQIKNSIYCTLIDIDPDTSIYSNIINDLGLVETVQIALASILGFSNPAINFLAAVFKILSYIKYLSIRYPIRLQRVLDSITPALITFNFAPNMPDSLEGCFNLQSIPYNFAKYELHSSFLVNYWSSLITLALILALVISLTLLMILLRKFKHVNKLLKQIRKVFKWNFLIIILCTNCDQLILYSSLDLRTLKLNSFSAFVSLATLFTCVAALLYVYSVLFRIIRDIRIVECKVAPEGPGAEIEAPSMEKWSEYQPLHRGYKNERLIQKSFMLIYITRVCLFYAVIAFLFEYPLLQTVLLNVLSFSMLSYLLIIRPFRSKLVFAQFVVDEVGISITNVCIFIFSMMDRDNDYSKVDERSMLGDVVIYTNISTSIWDMLCNCGYIILGIKAAYEHTKKYKAHGLASWLVVFLGPYEAGGMDVEVTPHKPKEVKKIPHNLRISIKRKKPHEMLTLELDGDRLDSTDRVSISTPVTLESPESARRDELRREFQKAGLVDSVVLSPQESRRALTHRRLLSNFSTNNASATRFETSATRLDG